MNDKCAVNRGFESLFEKRMKVRLKELTLFKDANPRRSIGVLYLQKGIVDYWHKDIAIPVILCLWLQNLASNAFAQICHEFKKYFSGVYIGSDVTTLAII